MCIRDSAWSADYLVRYEEAFAAVRDKKPEAIDLFSKLAAESPQDPLVRFYLERLRDGEVGIEIKMTEK